MKLKRVTLTPPETIEIDAPHIFLGGPIQGAPDWQAEAIDIIHDYDSDIVVASPRYDYSDRKFVYEKQVDWETHYLRRAAKHGSILFWLANQVEATPSRSYGQTSRFEFGEWKKSHELGQAKIAVGAEPDFGNVRYITRRLSQDCPEIKIHNNLVDLCKNAVDLAQIKN